MTEQHGNSPWTSSDFNCACTHVGLGQIWAASIQPLHHVVILSPWRRISAQPDDGVRAWQSGHRGFPGINLPLSLDFLNRTFILVFGAVIPDSRNRGSILTSRRIPYS